MKKTSTADQRARMRRDILFALERLLQNRRYVEIGVNEICAEAHISKPTFYRYFQNKDSIIQWMSKEAMSCGVAQVGRKYTWFEGHYRTMTVFLRHKVYYSDPQSPAVTSSLQAFSSGYLKETLIETLTDYKKVEITEKLVFQIEALNYALGQITRQWGAEGMRIPPETVAEYLTSVVPYDLYKLLNEPVETASKPQASPDDTPDKS